MKVWLPWFLLSYPFSLQMNQGVFCTFLCSQTNYVIFRKNLQSRILSAKKNGTVGKIGRTIPTQPIPRDTQPIIMKMIFLSFKFALLGLFFVLRIFDKFSQSVKTFGTYYMFKFAGIGCSCCFIYAEIFKHFTKHTITLVNAFGNLFA